MPGMTLPPGFRFHPTDEELVSYYLKKRVKGAAIEFDVIADVDLYKCEPWDLPSKSLLPSSDAEWFFFSPRDRKYPNGSRTNRATEAGYWKATGRDRFVKSGAKTIGMKKTLVFYLGRAPQGERTDWLMHEYRLEGEERETTTTNVSKEAFVLCRVFKKNGLGPPKNLGQSSVEEGIENTDSAVEEKNPVFLENDVKPNLLLPPLVFTTASQEAMPVKQHVDNYPTEETAMLPSTSTDYMLDDYSFAKMDATFWESMNWMDFDGTDVLGSAADAPRTDLAKSWVNESGGDNIRGENFWNGPILKYEEPPISQPYYMLPTLGSDISDLDFLPPLEDQSPSPPTLPPAEECDLVAKNTQPTAIQIRPRLSSAAPSAEESDFGSKSAQPTTIQIRPRLPSAAPSTSPETNPSNPGPWTAKRRILFQKRNAPSLPSVSLSGSSPPERSVLENQRNAIPAASQQELDDVQDNGLERSQSRMRIESEIETVQSNSWAAAMIISPHTDAAGAQRKDFSGASLPTSEVLDGARDTGMGLLRQQYVTGGSTEPSHGAESVVGLRAACASLEDDAASRDTSCLSAGGQEGGSARWSSPTKKVNMADASSMIESMDHNIPLTPVAGFVKLVNSVCLKRQGAEDLPSGSKQSKPKGSLELPPGIGSIHVNAVTITCSCNKFSNQPHVQATVCDCYSKSQAVYAHVLPGPWEKSVEKTVGGLEDSNKIERRNSSKKGFVCVFFMGAVSACLGYFVFQGFWRVTRQVLRCAVHMVTPATDM